MVKGFVRKDSSEPGDVRSMVKSWRPSTSKASERMIQRRVSDGSTGKAGELLMPSEAFHLLSDSSFWSARSNRLVVWPSARQRRNIGSIDNNIVPTGIAILLRRTIY